MLKRVFIIVFLLASVSQICFSKAGKSGWMILRKARSAKFKSITVTPVMAVRGDLAGVFYNPAVLSLNQYREIFVLTEIGLASDMFGGVVYGHPFKKSCLAGGFVYYNAGKIELNWLEGSTLKTEEVTAQKDLLAIISYGSL